MLMVKKVLEGEYLGMGDYVKEFENNLSNYLGRPAICVVNGTAAVQLALQAAGIKEGDEVLVQSLTYIASFQAISATNATPVSCDVDPKTMTISLKDAEKRLTNKTKAIMPVHYSGGVGPLEAIYDFARANNLRVIEDAAHAFGSTYKNKLIGSFGDTSCFSFDGIKNITSGEGGCIVSGDEELIALASDLRLLGVQKDSQQRYKNERSWFFDVDKQGWRYHMSNIMAGIGIAQLDRFKLFKDKRQMLAKIYCESISNNSIYFIPHDYDEVVPHIFPIIFNDKESRERAKNLLANADISTGFHYFPNHLLTLYKSSYNLPITEEIFERIITLPLHTDLSVNDIHEICSIINRI